MASNLTHDDILELDKEVKKLRKEVSLLRSSRLNLVTFADNAGEDDDEIEPIPDLRLQRKSQRQNDLVDITVAFSDTATKTADDLVNSLKNNGRGFFKVASLPCYNNVYICEKGIKNSFDPRFVEDAVVNSNAVVVILSQGCLEQRSVEFVTEACLHYNTRIILVHDLRSCPFPGENEQPMVLQEAGVFHDKAVTYMKHYADICCQQIFRKMQKTPELQSELCLVYTYDHIYLMEGILTHFQDIKITTLQLEKLPDPEWSEKARKTLGNTRAVAIVLSKIMKTDMMESLVYVLDLSKVNKLRHYFLHNHSSTPVMYSSFKHSLQVNYGGKYDKFFAKNKEILFDAATISAGMKRLIDEEKAVGGCRSSDTSEIATRCFLSHKRSSAQGLAGRLWQGLKAQYKVFLDSEADFDLHDLKLIVKHTKLFIFILSEGVLDSYWCLQELRAAVQEKKKILFLHDISYHVPSVFSPELADVAELLRTHQMLDYMAEFYDEAIHAIKQLMGPPDPLIKEILEHLEDEDPALAKAIQNKELSPDGTLKYTAQMCTVFSLKDYLEALDKYFGIPLSQVHSANLSGCALVTDDDVRQLLKYCKHLQVLNLRECHEITDSAFEELSHPELQFLDLQGCYQISSATLKRLATSCTNLMSLVLNNCFKMEDEGVISVVTSNPNIGVLELNACFLLSNHALRHIAKSCTRLQVLNCLDCDRINHQGLYAIATSCKHLQVLNLKDCKNIPAESLKCLADGCHELKELNVAGCDITDEGLAALGECPSLQKLTLDYCLKVSHKGIQKMTESCRSIKHLSLRYCTAVGDRSFKHIGLHLLNLEHLDVSGCLTLSDCALLYLAVKVKHLTEVDLSKCGYIGDAGMYYLTSANPNIRKLKLDLCRSIDDKCLRLISIHCPHLQELSVVGCQAITDHGVAHIAALEELTRLTLGECYRITDNGIAHLGTRSTKLRYLNLFQCTKISAAGVEALSSACKELEELDLTSCCGFDQSALEHIATHFQNLKSLILAKCFQIENQGIKKLSQGCHNLRHLDLTKTPVTATVLKYVSQFSKLQSLILAECSEVDDAGLNYLSEANLNITNLDLSLCAKISDAGLKHIASGCPSLSSLNLSDCPKVTDDGLAYLSEHCRLLKSISLSGKSVSSSGLMELLQGCINMPTVVKLNNCIRLDDLTSQHLAEACRNLEVLNLSNCFKLSDHSLKHIGDHCKRIRHLDISNCQAVSDVGLQTFADHFDQLDVLKLSGCGRITDDGLSNLKPLKEFILGRCPKITDDGINTIAQKGLGLRILELEDCDNLTDKSLISIGTHCSSLITINIAACERLTDKGIKALTEGCGSLETIDIGRCRNLTDASLVYIANRCHNLRIMKLPGLPLVTDEGIRELAQGCSEVDTIDLTDCVKLTDSSLTYMADGLLNLLRIRVINWPNLSDRGLAKLAQIPALKTLELTGCSQVTDYGIEMLSEGCFNIQNVAVGNCKQLTDTSMKHLGTNCPLVKTLDITSCDQITDEGMKHIAFGCRYIYSITITGCSLITKVGKEYFGGRQGRLFEKKRLAERTYQSFQLRK